MKTSCLLGAATLSVALLLPFAGCGGPQGTSTASSALVGQSSLAVKATPIPKKLIYVSSDGGASYVLTYPDGKLVGTINESSQGVCSDTSGNAFLIVSTTILVYAHGATTENQTISLPSQGFGCAVDPVTGDLAVVTSNQNEITIFTPPYAKSKAYPYTSFSASFCGYDNQGNLFVDGRTVGSNALGLLKLPAGGSSLQSITITPPADLSAGSVQWDGKYLTVEVAIGRKHPHAFIDRLEVTGSTATVVAKTTFKGLPQSAYLSWIEGKRILLIYARLGRGNVNIGIWKYPGGGKPLVQIKNPSGNFSRLFGITVSKSDQ